LVWTECNLIKTYVSNCRYCFLVRKSYIFNS